MPAAQAWGRAAVGYAIGKGVSSRAYPAKTSGSDQSKWPAASISARATRRAASVYPWRASPQAVSDVSCGQTVPLWYEIGLYAASSLAIVRIPQPDQSDSERSWSTTGATRSGRTIPLQSR